jgi:dolichol-phosphate mannosyltransferase
VSPDGSDSDPSTHAALGGSIALPQDAGLDRVLACVFAYNEGEKLHATLARFPPDFEGDVLVVDDGSTDGSIERIDEDKHRVLRMGTLVGLGAAIRAAIRYAQDHGYHVMVVLAANDKDRPAEIARLLRPIREGGCYAVFGSRFLPGGHYGNMPKYREFATKHVHPKLFSAFARARLTDTSNGFRALHLKLFDDTRLDINQDWLDEYEMERYIQFKLVRLGYRYAEVPVTKIYPPKSMGQTKMKPITGWWSMLKPIFLLGLGIKK